MAIGATIFTCDIALADVDRGVYEDVRVRLAKHPSETDEFMVTRLLAYCLEYTEGIDFAAGGVSSTDESAVVVRDLTGKITAWIEVGAPDAARLHSGSKAADHVAVYTHRDPVKLLASWEGKRIHRAADIVLRSFDSSFIDGMVRALSRRNVITVSVTEGQLYVEINGEHVSTAFGEHTVA